MPKKPPLSLVPPVGTVVTLPDPPPSLGEAGLSLWRSVQSQYQILDAGGLEILRQACAACDRAAQYAAIIDEQGPVIMTKTGLREHPLVKAEIATRALVGRLISRLGLDIEALRPLPGRPPTPSGWTPPAR
jgi:phage terminase small subunit